ncbi:AraC family transcriptional regulator [Sediminibacter sp. Hel_I_10]|uniref:helix-turn-helix domain-containing protein n=1 Tax=Sediminibacter sp. Hel_I_10 TaxID=1392490 RepID=UPI000B0DCBE8|nr:helix-turn-helix domain-containing protein [Sediminibacter sp. Hel_I_10]
MGELIIFNFNQKSSILLIFFFNAIVFSFLLLKKGFRENRRDSYWLGLFILLCGMYICPFMLGYAGWYSIKNYREFLFFTPFQQLFLIGPIIFFYTQSLLNKDFKLLKKHYIHFLPAMLYMLYSIIIFITDKWILSEFYFYADGRDKDLAFWYQMTGLVSMLFYLILSLKFYKNYRKLIVQEVSYADEVLLKWISHFMIIFSLLLVLRVCFFILNPEWGEFGSKYWYYLCFSILFFYIAITGYSNTIRATVAFNAGLPQKLKMEDEIHLSIFESDEIEVSNIEDWKIKIQLLLEEKKIYTNSNLTLSDIALHLNTNRNLISKIINQGFNMNFNDFINLKRIDAVIEKIKNGDHIDNTLLGIALDSGFNSKTTFNRAFKKHTSLTPKQFILKNKY